LLTPDQNKTAQPLLECIEMQTGPNPTASVIWLHGLGADGNDFAPIVPELNLTGCPDIRFVFPHANTMPVTINNGYVMRAWYDILGADLVRREDEAGIRNSAVQIEALIARERSRGVASNKIVLAGFSQGCAMALFTGLRHAETLAGLVALSGYLPIADKTANEISGANKSTPIFMAHGAQDPVVPQARAEASRELLTGFGYSIEWQSYPMPHSVHPKEIADVAGFMRKVLM
jgi:phospholipase/carboxylesterase